MKTILIFSDTHGNRTALRKAYHIMKETDFIFHLGDGARDMMEFSDIFDKLYAVDGNCDLGVTGSREMVVEIEDRKILLTHGDIYGVKRGTDFLLSYAKKLGVDIVLYGHTHSKSIVEKDNILMINPGSLSYSTAEKSCCYLVINGKNAVATLNEKIFL